MTEMEPKSNANTPQTELQEQYLKSLEQCEEGSLVEGTVIQVNSDYVFIDIGYKSEGKIPKEEFTEIPNVNDTVNVIIVKKENKNGELVVSKKQADGKIFWKDLREAYQNQTPIKGTISSVIKGGFDVDLDHGIHAFLPMSNTDTSRVQNPDKYVGMKTQFLVERLYRNKKINIVLSRRKWLEEERTRAKKEFYENTSIGDTVKGKVKSFTSFGAFIDLGGFDGLLHINDMSWGHVTRPKDFVKKGDEVELKVIRMEPDEDKINLSLKHFTDDPWSTFEDNYNVDDVVKGKVTKLTDFGAFIEIEEGIEGLAHISELSWVKHINHPKEVLSIGEEVEAKILDYDLHNGKVSLGIKQTFSNPWETIEEKYPEGTHVNGKVKKITNSGAFIEIEEGIDGFLHVDDLSWTKKIKNPRSMFKEGEEIDTVVLKANAEDRRIQLGYKQLSDDPWQILNDEFSKGSVIEGEITNITDFGMFVRVKGGIEGLISKSHVADPKVEDPESIMSKYNVGDKVKCAVLEVNPKRQKLALSIKEYHNKLQRQEISKYIHDDEDEVEKSTLGELLQDKGEEISE